MTMPIIMVTPSTAANAYKSVDAGTSGAASFGGVLQRALQGAVDANQQAENLSTQAIAGGGNLTEVVAAVSKAELALQTTATIRDRMLRATMMVLLKLGGPPLGVALAVGIVMSLLQAVTQINEQTLAFVPKVMAIGATLVILGPFMTETLIDFSHLLFDRLVAIGGQ
jgi:flagellar biosynthetic protein FliQ